MSAGFTRMGKQVLRDGEHYADACDEEAADFMLGALKLRHCIEKVWANHPSSERGSV